MAVTALVLTLTDDETERMAALSELARQPGVTVGDPFGARFPVVVDTESTREDKKCFKRIEALEGVHLIELVSVDYDDDTHPRDDGNQAGSAS
ncbi:MAG: hypothetical protein ABFS86_20320 [Planctomycetota bacterium]